MKRRTWRAGLMAGAMLLAVAAGLMGYAGGPGARGYAQAERAYGAQLILLVPGPGQNGTPANLPVTVHGYLYGEGEPAPVVGSITAGLSQVEEAARSAGVRVELLDGDTSGKAYYFVDRQVRDTESIASRFGDVVYAGSRQLLVGVPQESERAMVEAFGAAGADLALAPPAGLPSPAAQPATTPEPPAAVPGEAPDPAVAALIAQVDGGRISAHIARLSGVQTISTGTADVTLKTRYTFATNARTVEAAVFHQYTALGYAPAYANWTYGSYSGRNVVAELRGTVNPQRIWLVGGHFDDTSGVPYSDAPGADDNASGIAATLEIARLLKGKRLADTVRFVNFGAEEQGHWGSIVYARSLTSSGAQVVGYVDLDMIGWDGDGDRTIEVHSGTSANSVAFAQRFLGANERYGQGLRVELKQSSASRFSDHASFWDQGYPAFMTIENFFDDAIGRDRNPYYHTTGDLLPGVDLDYVTRATRTALALLAEGAVLLGDEATPTPTATETAGPTQTATATATLLPPTCSERVTNGGFETAAGWSFAATGNPGGYSAARAHSGARSARLGVAPATGVAEEPAPPPGRSGAAQNLLGETAPLGASYSTAYQTVSVPAGATYARLSYWRWLGTDNPAGNGDFQRVLLLKPGAYSLLQMLSTTLANEGGWRREQYDLAAYAGQSVVVYFEVYNDDTSATPRTWMYVDDASLLACDEEPAWQWSNHVWLPVLLFEAP